MTNSTELTGHTYVKKNECWPLLPAPYININTKFIVPAWLRLFKFKCKGPTTTTVKYLYDLGVHKEFLIRTYIRLINWIL